MADRSESELLIDALKQVLREQGVTYRELGRRLRLSEPTIKRVFSDRRVTLARLEAMCRAVGVSVFDLGKRAEAGTHADLYTLTVAQERRLVREVELFYFFWMLVNRHSLASIRRRYRMTDTKVRRYLTELHTLGILELGSGDRFVLKIPPNVVWNPDGPIDRFLVSRSVPAFLRGRFRGDNEYFRFTVGALTPRSAALFREQLEALAEKIFRQSVGTDAMQPGARRTGTLVAFGPMDFSLREVARTDADETDRGR